jgi:hypothetical protein
MKRAKDTPVVERLVSPLGDCLTEESARRLLALKPDPELQARVDDMASRHTEGRLTPEEQAEYGRYVSYATFIAILKSKARQMLNASHGA